MQIWGTFIFLSVFFPKSYHGSLIMTWLEVALSYSTQCNNFLHELKLFWSHVHNLLRHSNYVMFFPKSYHDSLIMTWLEVELSYSTQSNNFLHELKIFVSHVHNLLRHSKYVKFSVFFKVPLWQPQNDMVARCIHEFKQFLSHVLNLLQPCQNFNVLVYVIFHESKQYSLRMMW